MAFTTHFVSPEPARAEVDALPGATVLEFGTGWCGFCLRAQPLIASAFQGHPELRHLKVEDGPGRPLGRSFRIKLWPSLVLMKNGQEIERLVRPQSTAEIEQALARLAG
ncbi:thioredoxin family protein [Ideonella sp.]|uniref:thioredoxin family protein n=1 Tax=Ideonella sp. TaxID=1929293 RepID=UPI002B469177|nr:thioredoxin family protein [Ideonella sp.]HJV68647.1 thioredoxin family protein [Ideonella sp.]